jgi:hypothetical protein
VTAVNVPASSVSDHACGLGEVRPAPTGPAEKASVFATESDVSTSRFVVTISIGAVPRPVARPRESRKQRPRPMTYYEAL